MSVEIPFPKVQVFETYRDKLADLVPYLPNVRAIEVTSRKDDGPVVRLVNRWKGGGDIPAVARQFLPEGLLEWEDYADWDSRTFHTDWRQEVPAMKGAFHSKGTNSFEELSPTLTRMRIHGSIDVDASKIPGVPRLLSRVVGPPVEAFLIAAIKPNLVSVSKGVERYLQDHAQK